MDVLSLMLSLQKAFFYILMFFWIYQLFICLFAFTAKKKNKVMSRHEHRFMAIISARNEENVIGNLLESIKNQNYKFVDTYVIADNCTDKTAEIARFHGANVFVREDIKRRSKGFALEWFFNEVGINKLKSYDAFTIFDADNIVSKDFFLKMNEKLCEGEKIIQGYRDIINPDDSWVSGNYAIFYWTMNRCYHYSRYKLGLSPMVNGTGFTVSMDVLIKNNGWHSETLTEDIEFSIDSIIKGYKIAWAHDAVVFDEQPQKFSTSCRQRLRWSVGHLQCFKKFWKAMLRHPQKDVVLLDTAIYILGMPMMLLSLIVSFIDILKVFFIDELTYFTLIGGVKFSLITIFIAVCQATLVTIFERKNIKKVWKGIATYPIFLISWVVLNIVAFFKTDLDWKPIAHVGAEVK